MPATSAAARRSIQQWVAWGGRRLQAAGLFFGHGTDNARDEADTLIRWALRLPHQPSAKRLKAIPGPRQARRIEALITQRMESGRPAAYLTGEIWYAGLRFFVDERVLVPRSPIAELIVERFRPWITRDPARILDLCSGSGCLAIACAKAFPRARIDAAELDPGALQVLRKNVALHRLGSRVRVVQSDLFKALAGEPYDLIVSNPPYVPTARWQAMPKEYQHEPRIALESGADGMDLVGKILQAAARHLTPTGTLVCEVGGSVPEFTHRFPTLACYWPEFEHGGDGVFVTSRTDLMNWKPKNVR